MCAGFNDIEHERFVRFGAFLTASSRTVGCAVAYPLGMCLDTIYPEYTPPIVTTTETPTTTTVTTQAPPPQCGSSTSGSQFLVMFMANIDQEEVNLALSIVAPDELVDSQVTVEVFAPLDASFRVLVNISRSQTSLVEIPDRLRMTTTGRGTNAVLVTSPEPVTVYGQNTAGTSCGGLIVLPLSGLGRHYYVVSWFPPSQYTQMAVAAVEDATTVQITFPGDDQLEVSDMRSRSHVTTSSR